MARKMPKQLVALSSSAIAAIYLAGFVYTRGADASLASAAAASSAPATPLAGSPAGLTDAGAPTAVVSASALPSAIAAASPAATATAPAASATSPATTATSTPASATSPASSAAAPATTAGYQDGTYTGTGTSRRGNVTVSLTVQSGTIANVTIASTTTQYPVSRIASLPAQVIARQTGQVDNITGATYSAQAFQMAVQAALSKAKA